jgi:hypothetical protein
LHVVDTEGDFGVATGETVCLGVSGLSARMPGPLPCSCETTVHVELPGGWDVVAAAVVAGGEQDREGWTYRLVFGHLEPGDVEAIRSLVTAAA